MRVPPGRSRFHGCRAAGAVVELHPGRPGPGRQRPDLEVGAAHHQAIARLHPDPPGSGTGPGDQEAQEPGTDRPRRRRRQQQDPGGRGQQPLAVPAYPGPNRQVIQLPDGDHPGGLAQEAVDKRRRVSLRPGPQLVSVDQVIPEAGELPFQFQGEPVRLQALQAAPLQESLDQENGQRRGQQPARQPGGPSDQTEKVFEGENKQQRAGQPESGQPAGLGRPSALDQPPVVLQVGLDQDSRLFHDGFPRFQITPWRRRRNQQRLSIRKTAGSRKRRAGRASETL
ncbi:MAG: hypothetical protein BWY73_00842 [candidate division TA06 bacterium ADurb.Bin417]|uniref:Uncharacterized protein n=1 Tax=candidate division TA06 bacterium ADurb.Bin417 TaxID=1852828 RepID=A0A1V5MGJ8_UNCT6|nr:MAG: hypothetical protein BWY73_00842 [candidate division TA06 bacterium ADurb.Bin417]